jgi:hypothetical protein
MKGILIMLMLTVSASVFGQDPPNFQASFDAADKVLSSPNRPKWRKSYTITADTVGAGAATAKALQVIDVKIWRHSKNIEAVEAEMIELTDMLGKALSGADHSISLNISFNELTFKPVSDGTYSVTPIRVTSFCAGSYCSATATGGRVTQHVSIVPSGTRALVTKHWQNY